VKVTVNGAPREVPDGARVADLVADLVADPSEARGIAVAVDGVVVRRVEWPRTRLAAGSQVELVHAVQGG